MKTIMNIVWIGIVLCVCSCSPTGALDKPGVQPMDGQGVEAIPEGQNAQEGVTLTLEERAVKDPTAESWDQIGLRLSNGSGRSVRFRGYAETQPWYRMQRLIEGRWVDHNVGWFCGTGLRECEIPTGKSSLIPVSVRQDLYPIRVGVTYGLGTNKKEDLTVWSPRIDAR